MDLWGNLLPIAIGVFFFASLLRRMGRRAGQTRGVPARVPAPAPPRPVRRRLSEPPAAAPATVVSVRAPIVPAMSDMLSAEAAAAFPALDLSLGDIGTPAGAPKRRARRAVGGIPIGSRGWGANAIVAAEVLGTPVGLRPGATVGVPHAF
jgi:hypothetical protein